MAGFHADMDIGRVLLCDAGGYSCHAAGRGCFLGHLPAAGNKHNDRHFHFWHRLRLAGGMQYVQKQTALVFCQHRRVVQRPRAIGAIDRLTGR